jgi:hypothetical protein
MGCNEFSRRKNCPNPQKLVLIWSGGIELRPVSFLGGDEGFRRIVSASQKREDSSRVVCISWEKKC